ncbi:MAG: DUF1343 domain-containing protein [Elusimicrobia bacterium]|nr:DUF1343 domain-containing protein [Elusimicrobiota bacterium]
MIKALGFALAVIASPAWAEPSVLPGVDVLLADGAASLRGKRVALITHAAAVTTGLELTADALARAPGVKIVALMGPEHGVRGARLATETVVDERDPKLGVPIYSLHRSTSIYDADTNKPTPAMLKGVDAVVYDVQDIGSRSYTYIVSMALAMEAAADAGIPFFVLDRPDPVGGERVEGNVPPEDWKRSTVNWLRIPYVYGMTPGELARMINGEGWLRGGRRVDLKVVEMKGWRREMRFSDTGLLWVPTSPHVPRIETAFFYPATGILGELGTFNIGVGYPQPFELIGAPGIDGEKLASKLNELGLPGVRFRPLSFKPFYAAHKGTLCQGVQIHLLDLRKAPLVELQLYAMEAVRALFPDAAIFPPDTLEETGRPRFDATFGTGEASAAIAEGRPIKDVLAAWRKQAADFAERRKKYLLYP